MTHPPGSLEARVDTAVKDAWSWRRFAVVATVGALIAGGVAASVASTVSNAQAALLAAQVQANTASRQARDLADAVSSACLTTPATTSLPCSQAGLINAAVNSYMSSHPAPPGKDGVGVTTTQVTRCELLVTLTDGRVIDAGPVCSSPTPR